MTAGGGPSFRVEPGGSLTGAFRVPGDKSISHRFVMLSALAEGESQAEGFLEGADALATVAAFRAMGVAIDGPDAGRIRVRGVGLAGLQAPQGDLDMGNSGTAMRLMAGLLSGQHFASRLVGDASLSRRPMRRVTDPLRAMGARIESAAGGMPPLSLQPSPDLHGIDYPMPVASAQVKSCLMLAGLYAAGELSVTEPAPSRDHTERMLEAFGQPVHVEGNRVSMTGAGVLRGCSMRIPADISSAAFFLVGASIAPGASLVLEGVGVNPTRTGVLQVLEAMGARIRVENPRTEGGEPVADLHVEHAPLRGIQIPESLVPLGIDEFPVLMVAAACAEGDTVLSGAAELRVKESDRIRAMVAGLEALGVRVEERADGMRVSGGRLSGGTVDSLGDHRIAMAFAMAGLRAEGPVTVTDCANVDTSFPGFADLARSAGLAISVEGR